MAGKKILRNTTVNERVYNKEYVDYLESLVVKLSGNQTISDIKTFGQSPIVPTPTEPTQVANREYADSILGSFATPDYARMESINRISTNNGTWTADRNGYIRFYVRTERSGGSFASTNVTINDTLIFQRASLTETISEIYNIIAVKQGDTVKIYVGTNGTLTYLSISAYFIPVVSNNFNVYPDWGKGVRTDYNVPATAGTVFTANNDGLYVFYNNLAVRRDMSVNGQFAFAFFDAAWQTAHLSLRKGDVVTLAAGTAFTLVVYYYPNHVSAAGADVYSTTETDTGKIWINGKRIYRRVFAGNIVGAANTDVEITLASGIDEAISISGWYQQGGAYDSKYDISLMNPSNPIQFAVRSNGNLQFYSRVANIRQGTTNNMYHIIAEYTKI